MPLPLFLALVVVLVMIGTGAKKAWGYVNGMQVELELAPIGDGFQLRADAAAAFRQMAGVAAVRDGVFFKINRAFATNEQQTELHELYLAGTGNLAAKPGFSNHQGGIALDIETAGGTNAAFKWLTANASKFGFKRTVASEPWHWEYRL